MGAMTACERIEVLGSIFLEILLLSILFSEEMKVPIFLATCRPSAASLSTTTPCQRGVSSSCMCGCSVIVCVVIVCACAVCCVCACVCVYQSCTLFGRVEPYRLSKGHQPCVLCTFVCCKSSSHCPIPVPVLLNTTLCPSNQG